MFQMQATFVVIVVALALYMRERVPLELTSLGVVCALMILFHFAPVAGPDGANLLDAKRLLEGFANPALIAVLALLVIGEGLARTGMLDQAAQIIFRVGGRGWRSIVLVLVVVETLLARWFSHAQRTGAGGAGIGLQPTMSTAGSPAAIRSLGRGGAG